MAKKRYNVCIREEDSKWVEVEAESIDDAEDIASEMYANGEITLDYYGDVYCEAEERAAETPLEELRLPLYVTDFLKLKSIHTVADLLKCDIIEVYGAVPQVIMSVIWALFRDGWIRNVYDISNAGKVVTLLDKSYAD